MLHLVTRYYKVTFPFTQITNITHNSVTLTWVPGYDGGLTQTFRVRYHSEDFEQFTVSRLKKLINIVNELVLLEVWVTLKKTINIVKKFEHYTETKNIESFWPKKLSHWRN